MHNSIKSKKIRIAGFFAVLFLLITWEQRKLGDVGSVAMNRRIFKEQTTLNGDVPFYKIGTFGGVADAFISEQLFEEYKAKYPYPKVGDILVSASGSIGRFVEYKGEKAYFQDSNIIWLDHNDSIDKVFLKAFYAVVKWAGLEGSTIKRLYNKNILDTRISLPTITEQRQVGRFFEQLDNLITLHQRKCDKLKNIKAALLEKMFPAEGKNTPAIRFKGFTDAWEQRKFDYFFTERTDRSGDGELISVTINSGIKKFAELNRFDSKPEDMSNYKVVCEGDIAYNSMRMWQGASGYSPYNGILSPAYTVIVPKNGVSSKFFAYVLKRPKMIHLFEINSQGLTKDTWNLKFPAFSQIEATAPMSFDEQDQISTFLEQLDNLITLHQRKVEKLKNIKSALLEKMFV